MDQNNNEPRPGEQGSLKVEIFYELRPILGFEAILQGWGGGGVVVIDLVDRYDETKVRSSKIKQIYILFRNFYIFYKSTLF